MDVEVHFDNPGDASVAFPDEGVTMSLPVERIGDDFYRLNNLGQTTFPCPLGRRAERWQPGRKAATYKAPPEQEWRFDGEKWSYISEMA